MYGYIYKLWDMKEGGHRLRELNRMTLLEKSDHNAIAALQLDKCKRLLLHAEQTSPWYKKVFKEAGFNAAEFNDLTQLQNLPITRKLDIRNNEAEFISTSFEKSDLNQAKTGGSTGVSLNLYFDDRCQQMRNAAQNYSDSFAGWKPGAKVGALWGNPPISKTLKQKIRSRLLGRTIYLDTMSLDEESMALFVRELKRHKPEVLFGHAHSIYLFAKFLKGKAEFSLRPKGIVATSMMLLEHERIVIERVFNTKVTNRYGCEEVGLIAWECKEHQGMHVNCHHLVVESVDERGQPVAEGKAGKLVITDLNNLAMPLIRYQVEDVGVLSNRVCACGINLPILERLEGRLADFLRKPDGTPVAGVSLVERTLTKIPGIEQMQLVQDSSTELKINRVKGQDYSLKTDSLLIKELVSIFGADMKIDIIDVTKIPQERSGKYRFSICNI